MSESTTPFFSVVIPVYNSEKYLDDCINSVFRQTCDDFELILVDDESSDSSSSICDKWQTIFPEKVIVIHQKNTGVYLAKRNGIIKSNGRYIYVIDNDDLIVSERAFEKIKDTIVKTGSDLILFNATDNISNGHLLCNIPFEEGCVFEKERLSLIYDDFLKHKNLHHIWMMVFSKSLFDFEFEYDADFRMLRDGPFLIAPIISKATKIIYLKDIFYYWRIQNLSSASKHYDVLGFYKSVRYLHQLIKKLSVEWKYKSEQTDSLLKSNYMIDISIAAIKSRKMSSNSPISQKDFLNLLSEDDLFRKEYTLKDLNLSKRIIVKALFHKRFWIINAINIILNTIK